jgi:glycosyltransferase involved in cell wall biosynthesis
MDGHIVTFHDLFPLDSPQWYQTSFAAWRNFCLHRLALTAAHVIAVSDYTKGRLIHHFGVDPVKITIIHNGVDHQMFSSSLESVAATRSALKLPSATYLLSVGSLEPRKNLKRLLAAWSAVVNQLAGDVWLVISGSGNRTVYKSAGLGEVPPRVFLTGYVPEEYLQGLYAGSLGFVYPSLAEGFGLPALEAMACGAPVITSATTALPEVCGSAALYIDPTDIEALAGAMKLVIEDARLRDKLSRMGLERAAQFTWDRAADKTLSVLRKFAGNGLK